MDKEIQVLNLVKKVLPSTTVRKTDIEYIFSFEDHHTAWPFDLVDSTPSGQLPRVASFVAHELFTLKVDGEIK